MSPLSPGRTPSTASGGALALASCSNMERPLYVRRVKPAAGSLQNRCNPEPRRVLPRGAPKVVRASGRFRLRWLLSNSGHTSPGKGDRHPPRPRPGETSTASSGSPWPMRDYDPWMLKPGDPAPDFELPDQNGDPVRLSDLRGKTVVL